MTFIPTTSREIALGVRQQKGITSNVTSAHRPDLVSPDLMLRDLRVVILIRSERKGHLSLTVVSPHFSGRSLLRSAGPRRTADAAHRRGLRVATRYWTVATGARRVICAVCPRPPVIAV
jgi:hypothetical protein